VATSGIILAAVYSLRMIQKSFFGVSLHSDESTNAETKNSSPADSNQAHTPKKIITDLNTREQVTLLLMCLALILMGLHPQPIFNLVNSSLMEIASLFQTPFQDPFQPEIQLLEVQL
jgi:NADH-quinone oxidoreductase subunit M